MGLLDRFMSGERPESTRRLAFELVMRATALAGEDPPPGVDDMPTPVMLRHARGALARTTEDRRRLTTLEKELDALRRENLRLCREAEPAPAEPPPVAEDLIELSDRVTARKEADPGLVRWLDGRVVQILRRLEVSRIVEDGVVDATRHEVVDVRSAEESGDAGQIAETVRPGYAWRGMILRPQQVIAYGEPS